MAGCNAPLGELTCNQCSYRLKDDKILHINPNLYVAALPNFLPQFQVQFWAKA